MFCDEARISALLHHPNIVQVYDFGQINGTYFLAMEYLRGKDLSAVMKALAGARRCRAAHIAQQVATGLHYAHTLTDADGKPPEHRASRRHAVEHHAAADRRP